jgi:hypothetical protein
MGTTKQVRITVYQVGQAFGCRGWVNDCRTGKLLAETRIFPHDFPAAAHEAAERMAADMGVEVVS